MPETNQASVDELISQLTAEASAYRLIRKEFKRLMETEPNEAKKRQGFWTAVEHIVALMEPNK